MSVLRHVCVCVCVCVFINGFYTQIRSMATLLKQQFDKDSVKFSQIIEVSSSGHEEDAK